MLIYVVDTKNWVQYARYQTLVSLFGLPRHLVLTARMFDVAQRLGLFRRASLYFSSWRLLYELSLSHPDFFFRYRRAKIAASVTSHSNIGGGIQPDKAFGYADPAAVFDKAIAFLDRLDMVSFNSMILFDAVGSKLTQPEAVYVPNGVDTSFFVPLVNSKRCQKPLVFGWVGKRRNAKNISLLEEFDDYCNQTGDFVLNSIILDKGTLAETLRSNHEMLRFYQSLDFLLVTSLNEGTPNPALEALACGVPVICTRVGNMPEVITDGYNGFFYDADFDSLKSVLQLVKSLDRTSLKQLGGNARDSVHPMWSWQIKGGAFVDFFQRLTGE